MNHQPTILAGDCLQIMPTLAAESVDAIVTDPPYGLGFMGRAWDDLPPGLDFAREALRVLKPGGHMLAFGGTRTWHRLAVAIEDAGFEIRDSIAWLYAGGLPKSRDVSGRTSTRQPGLSGKW
jgi:DNA modification methylase